MQFPHGYFNIIVVEDIFLEFDLGCVKIVFHKKLLHFDFVSANCFAFVSSFLLVCIYSMNYVALEFQDTDTQEYITAPRIGIE